MFRSFKYRIYPTRAQESRLIEALARNCELYNAALQERRDAYKKGKRVTTFDQNGELAGVRAVRPEYGDIAIVFQRGTLRRLDNAYTAFFARCKRGEKPGYPRFKSRHRFNTLSSEDVKYSPIVAGGKRITVPCIGKVKIKLHRRIEGRPKALRITRSAGRWYAALVCDDVPVQPLPETGRSVGIDLGLSTLVMTSEGEAFANHRAAEQARIRFERAQRRVSRREKGSNRRRKAVRLLARAHDYVTQVRRQASIDIANSLVRRYDTICVEKLNMKGLCRGRLAKQVHDASWSTIVYWLNVKAESAGREVVMVDPRGTSQECSTCGATVKKDLGVRTHVCPCGLVLDRDENAARNVLARGLRARGAAAAVGARL